MSTLCIAIVPHGADATIHPQLINYPRTSSSYKTGPRRDGDAGEENAPQNVVNLQDHDELPKVILMNGLGK